MDLATVDTHGLGATPKYYSDVDEQEQMRKQRTGNGSVREHQQNWKKWPLKVTKYNNHGCDSLCIEQQG